MFYIEENEKIVLFDENYGKLVDTLKFMPQYAGLEIQETDRPIVDFEFADTEEYKERKAKEERQRLDSLTLTPADVERALYKAKGMDFEDLKALIAEKIPTIDIKGLAIEFRAKDFYRGAMSGDIRLFDVVGALLGYSPDDMDELFKNKELPIEKEDIEPETNYSYIPSDEEPQEMQITSTNDEYVNIDDETPEENPDKESEAE